MCKRRVEVGRIFQFDKFGGQVPCGLYADKEGEPPEVDRGPGSAGISGKNYGPWLGDQDSNLD